jgi:glycosyltransferase involved in cell wall biosynthesis
MRSVLMLSFRFPPIVVPNSFRSGKFAKYLPEFGWRPVILTAGAAPGNQLDPGLRSELPDSLVIRTTPGRIPTLRGFTFLRKWVPFLAIDNLWRHYAYREALRLIDQWQCEVIWSTAPPPGCHLLAVELKKKTGLPVVLDYRDPWTDNPHHHYPTRWHRLYSLRLEKQVQQYADKAITVSRAFAGRIESISPVSERPWSDALIIPNGYDPIDFEEPKVSRHPFVVAHIGSIYRGRVPVALHIIESLALLENIDPALSQKLRLRFVGTIDSRIEVAVRTCLKQTRVEFVGNVTHAEAVRSMYEASLLLLVNDYVEMGSTTSKIYEYLATDRSILSIGCSEPVRELINGLEGCQHVNGDSPHKTADAIQSLLVVDTRSGLKARRRQILDKYTRRSLTQDLAMLLNQVNHK